MITISSPAIGINAPGLFPYKMDDESFIVPVSWDAKTIAQHIKSKALKVENKKNLSLTINCHGVADAQHHPAGLNLGNQILLEDLHHFKMLNGMVNKIWISSCRAAAEASGKKFCKTLADYTRASVVAGDVDQTVQASEYQELLKGNVIDNYEGRVFLFEPNGPGYLVFPNDDEVVRVK